MTELLSIAKHSDLIGQRVINRGTAEEVGRVEHLWLNPETHRILGIACKAGMLGRNKQAFIWQQVAAIGGESVLISSTGAIDLEKPENALESVIGHEVWTDSGNRAGVVKDLLINLATGEVMDYLFASSGWRGVTDGIYSLSATAVQSIGKKRLIASSVSVENAPQFAGGLSQKLTQAQEFIRDDYERTKADVASLVQGSRSLTEQAREKVSDAAGALQDKTQELADQTQILAEQAQAKLAEGLETAQTKVSEFGEQAKARLTDRVETTQETAAEVNESAETRVTGIANSLEDEQS